VKVGDVLKVSGKVERKEGKKIYITAQLENENGEIYVSMEGLSIGGISLSPENDAITNRTWSVIERPGGGAHVFADSGWLIPTYHKAKN
jgi:hypothetical protein